MKITRVVKGLAIAAFAGMAAVSSGARANAVIDCCFIGGGATNELQDSDADRILRDGVVQTSGSFMTGDVVESILRIDTVNSAAINSAVGTLNYGLWAYATLTINAITDTGGGTCDVGDQCIAFTTPVVNVYERADATNCLTLAPDAGITCAQDGGTPILTLTTVAADDFWTIEYTHTATGEIADIAGLTPGGGQTGLYHFGVTATSNLGNIPYAPNAMPDGVTGALHDFVGDGSGFPLETNVNSGWLISTNTTVLFKTVPEPGSLALLGLGLAAASWFGGRRRKA